MAIGSSGNVVLLALHHIRDSQTKVTRWPPNTLAIERRNRLAIHPLGGQKNTVNDFRCPIRRVPHEAVVDDVSSL
jgi:hypothetical protein